MAQPFDCFCGAPSCRGTISGAKDMTRAQLEGVWLNGHILKLLAERDAAVAAAANTAGVPSENGAKHSEPKPQPVSAMPTTSDDPTTQALRHALELAEKAAEAARSALRSYTETSQSRGSGVTAKVNGTTFANGTSNGNNGKATHDSFMNGTREFGAAAARRGPTSRELSGEMDGDTTSNVLSVI